MTSQPHKVAFYADIFYNSPLSPPYWIPPRDLDVEAILLGGDIHYRPDGLGEMLREIRATQHDATWLIVVPGNGEYAHQELGESRRQYREAVESVPGAVFPNRCCFPTTSSSYGRPCGREFRRAGRPSTMRSRWRCVNSKWAGGTRRRWW